MKKYTTLELCAGGGGQALGLEQAGFEHLACVEYESEFCKTLYYNRPKWNVICQDIRELDGHKFTKCDLLAGGVPCPPFSIAGKQLGENDDRDMFPSALKLIEEIHPRGIMLENVKGLMSKKFNDYRDSIVNKLQEHGYQVVYRVLEASDYGVPQLRPRFVLIALHERDMNHFAWPTPKTEKISVGEAIHDLLGENGWSGAKVIHTTATTIAPTIVGGSKKHGGPDLGPTRAKEQWRKIGIDGMGIANSAPEADFPVDKMPRLTVRMAARIQGFPDNWQFCGSKTTQYRQIGNAFPPPVAYALGTQIKLAFRKADNDKE
ncbi:MAG: DNA cytosine methyltransferase [Victivallaceae bacterium]